MGSSVQPVQPSPQEIARIQGNVGRMRAQGAPESDVLAYLQHEDSLASAGPPMDTSLSFRNLGRSAVQGATFGWGDELGLTDRAKEAAFKAGHPVADFLAKLGGGIVAPALAVAAAPALGTTLGGAAALGGTMGLLSGAGEADGNLGDRVKGGLLGGGLGAVGGAAGLAAGKVGGSIATKVLDRFHPERAVARAAGGLITPNVAAKLAQVEAIAPGGASIATTSAPQTGARVSRMLPMLRAVGASPTAGASAEASFTRQQTVLETARKALGKQMDALAGDIPAPSQTVLDQVREVLGSKAPSVPAGAATMPVQDARAALSRLRFDARQAAKQGTNANGVRVNDINTARAALQDHIYQHAPGFEALDRPYSTLMDQLGQTGKALKAVQDSRSNYAGNTAFGSTSGSLGGSLPHSSRGFVLDLIDKLMTDKAGAADAVANLIAKPGGPDLVDELLKRMPAASGRYSRFAAPVASTAIPAMRGLLSPSSP